MKQTRIAAGIVLALASTAAMAASGDRWYGSNTQREVVRDPIVVERVYLDGVPAYPERGVIYEERYVRPAPVIVERTYVVGPETYDLRRGGYEDPVKRLNPETGHLIGQGLFNKTGPNDFGG